MDFISITPELFIIGGGACILAEFLRGLILRIEDHPRLARSWRYLPGFLGMLGVLAFPSSVQAQNLLILLAHGALSPTVFFLVYPYLEKILPGKIKGSFEPRALPSEKEGEK